MPTLYALISFASLVAWALTLAFCSPGTLRVMLNARTKRGDLLATLLASVAFLFLAYRAVGLMFSTASAYGPAEMVARSALGLLSILCSVMCLRVLRQYRIRQV